MKTILAALVLACLSTGMLAQNTLAQVAQWNQTVVDRELRTAFYKALREVAVEYVNDLEEKGIPGAISFVDHQLDYPLQLTSSNFRHVTLNAAQAKLGYLLRYQAKTTAGTTVSIGLLTDSDSDAAAGLGTGRAAYASATEIAGDGGVMLCPVNRSGLEFMMGGLAVATLDENGAFRHQMDGAAILSLQAAILERTYDIYGFKPVAK